MAGRGCKYEATVGAGLPIIDTYQKLVETGDRVLRIEGCVSGTLMYIMSAVSQGERFSEAVRRAVERGYAEPDAREDLSGMDAARKGLILARLLGYRGPAPVPHSLVPRALEGVLARARSSRGCRSSTRNGRTRAAREKAKGRVLRYVVTATPRGGIGQAGGGARVEPDGRARGHAQPDRLHDPPLQQRAAGRQRAGRGAGGHRGGDPQRHLFAGGPG